MSDSRRMISPRKLIGFLSGMRAGTPFMRATFGEIRSPRKPSPRVMASAILPLRYVTSIEMPSSFSATNRSPATLGSPSFASSSSHRASQTRSSSSLVALLSDPMGISCRALSHSVTSAPEPTFARTGWAGDSARSSSSSASNAASEISGVPA